MKYLLWLLKAAIFFTLFAFALNNQQDATVYFFFGTQWTAPAVLIVLTAFALGVAVGVSVGVAVAPPGAVGVAVGVAVAVAVASAGSAAPLPLGM